MAARELRRVGRRDVAGDREGASGQLRPAARDLLEEGEPAHARHPQVGHDRVDRLAARQQVERVPAFGDYERKTSRVIPVVALERDPR